MDGGPGWLPPLRDGWRRLATDEDGVADGLGLANRAVPFALANLVWAPAADRLEEAAGWCAARQLEPAVAAATGTDLEEALVRAGFGPSHAFVLEEAPPPEADSAPAGESVAWDRARDAARLIAAQLGDAELELPLATVLASGLQSARGLECRIGYQGADPAAAVVGMRGRGWWLSLLEAGTAEALLGDAFAEARAHGRRAARLLQRAPDAGDADLRRWERGEPDTR